MLIFIGIKLKQFDPQQFQIFVNLLITQNILSCYEFMLNTRSDNKGGFPVIKVQIVFQIPFKIRDLKFN